MASTALRPRTPTEIVDAAFQILRAHYGAFVMCAALAYTPLLVIRLVLLGDPREELARDVGRFAGRYFITIGASMVTYAMMGAVLVTCTAQAYLGEPVDVRVAVRRLGARLGTVIATTILVSIMLVISLFLFLFPAMYVTARFFAVTQAVMLEDLGVGAAFARSSELSRGRKWQILNTLGLVILIYFVLFFGITAVSAIGGFVVQSIASTIVSVCVYPVVAITGVLLYYDARIQSEGLDIELMAGALAPAAPRAGG
ncbi:MAG: hypothetical protein JWN53_531 [Gemmatimonadetes bacterium]|jgi:hypothetical protein|nr:hypothetical protein [Gemmatimonadota bacterium]